MKCPHCNDGVHPSFDMCSFPKGPIGGFYWTFEHMECPSCHQAIITLAGFGGTSKTVPKFLVFPKGAMRPNAPPEVPQALQSDYNEACAVLPISPKASAALSRRCLQGLLTAQQFHHHLLAQAIELALKSNTLPRGVADNLDAIRHIGNFAAHPQKDSSTGEIIEVEPEEAEWNLDVLEALFDHYYVQPARAQAKRDALNKKLDNAGQKPMKQ